MGVGILACSKTKKTTKSASNEYTLSIANDGKATLSKSGSTKWSAGPFGADGAPYALSLRPSGDLVILSNGFGKIMWSSNSGCTGSGGYSAQVGAGGRHVPAQRQPSRARQPSPAPSPCSWPSRPLPPRRTGQQHWQPGGEGQHRLGGVGLVVRRGSRPWQQHHPAAQHLRHVLHLLQ